MGLVHRAALAAFFLLNGGDVMAFDIEAHRGGRALLPENTLPSFANALSLGVDTLELDIGVTRDGVIASPMNAVSTPISPAALMANMSPPQARSLSGSRWRR